MVLSNSESEDVFDPVLAKLVEPILSADSICRLLGERGGEIVDGQFGGDVFRGRNPVLLCFVLILQFLEKLPDQQAADRMRMDWKYALRQELDWPGFDYSSLCNFRKRLYAHGQEYAMFEQVLQYLAESGYLQEASADRCDACLGSVERLSRLELV